MKRWKSVRIHFLHIRLHLCLDFRIRKDCYVRDVRIYQILGFTVRKANPIPARKPRIDPYSVHKTKQMWSTC